MNSLIESNLRLNAMTVSTSIIAFSIGLYGMVWHRYDIIRLFVAIELMILATNMLLIVASTAQPDLNLDSQIVVPIVLAIAACEAAIGLGLLVVTYRVKGTVDFSSLNKLKG